MFKFATDKSYKITRFIRSLLSYQTPLVTKVNATGQYVTLELNCPTEKLKTSWSIYCEALNLFLPGISFGMPFSEEHIEMHDYHLLDAIVTQDGGLVRLIYNIPEHSHIFLPLGKTLFNLIEFTEKFQNKNNILVIHQKTLDEMKMAYENYLNKMDDYEKDEALRATILPILTKSIGVLHGATENNECISTDEANELIREAIIENRKNNLSIEQIHKLALSLSKWKKQNTNPKDILLPESKLSMFNNFLSQHPILSIFLAIGTTVTSIELSFLLKKYLQNIASSDNVEENKAIELGVGAVAIGSLFYSSKLAFDGLRWAYEKSLPEKPTAPSYNTTPEPRKLRKLHSMWAK